MEPGDRPDEIAGASEEHARRAQGVEAHEASGFHAPAGREETIDSVRLRVKSVWSPVSRRDDGLRILATRFRGRGMPASRYDVWMPSLGPSEELLTAVQKGDISWAQFAREFKKELFLDGPVDARSRTIKNHGQKFTLRLLKQLADREPVTLMCHCAEDQQQCHRFILRDVILRS
jgi:uncharacterized protein YeaO (DUF488 family)